MQLQLSLLETLPPEPGTAAWLALDDEHRAHAVAMLARLIAQFAAARRTVTVGANPERERE